MRIVRLRLRRRVIPLGNGMRRKRGALFGIIPEDPFRWKARSPQQREMMKNSERIRKTEEARSKGKKPLKEHWWD